MAAELVGTVGAVFGAVFGALRAAWASGGWLLALAALVAVGLVAWRD